MYQKHILLALIGNLAVLTVLHYNSVNCLRFFRRKIRGPSRRYHHVPYNIYESSPLKSYSSPNFLKSSQSTLSSSLSLPSLSSDSSISSSQPFLLPSLSNSQQYYPQQQQQQHNYLPTQPSSSSSSSSSSLIPYPALPSHNNEPLRRQLFVGNPIMAPLPVRALGKSRRLFTTFLNSRQSQLITSVLAGPLALATLIFALPILPSLLMAPLAFAGLPQAMTVMQDFMHSFGSHGGHHTAGLGIGKPINSLFSSFIDPLVSPLGGHHSSGDTSTGGKPTKSAIWKQIARIFRVGINRRVATPQNDNSTLSSTVDPLDSENIVDENDILSTVPSNITQLIYDSPNNQTDPLLASTSVTPDTLNPDSNIPSDNADSLLSSIPDPIINQLNNNDLKKSSRAMENMFGSIREIYSIIREGLRRYEITDSHCQSRIVCEIHQKIVGRKRSMIKSFALNAIDVLSIESRVDGWNNLNDKSKEAIKFYITAAKKGLADENCETEFDKCPTLPLKSRMLRSLILDSGHLIRTLKRSL